MRRRPVGYATGLDRHLPQLPWHATGQEEKAGLLAGAAALLNPIRWPEPFGMLMVEALACRTPVLTCPEGPAPDIVLHGVTGAPCDDEDGLAEAMAAATTGRVPGAGGHRVQAGRCTEEHVSRYRRVLADAPVLD